MTAGLGALIPDGTLVNVSGSPETRWVMLSQWTVDLAGSRQIGVP